MLLSGGCSDGHVFMQTSGRVPVPHGRFPHVGARCRIRTGLRRPSRPPPVSRLPRDPGAPRIRSGARRYGPRSAPALRVVRWQNRVDRALAGARRRRLRDGVLARVQPATRPVVPVEPSLPPDPAIPLPDRGLTQYADLNLELNARVETRLDRLRNLNCTAFDVSNPASGCEGGFPTPELGQQFELRASGVIADRLHVNVDFDGDRELNSPPTTPSISGTKAERTTSCGASRSAISTSSCRPRGSSRRPFPPTRSDCRRMRSLDRSNSGRSWLNRKGPR